MRAPRRPAGWWAPVALAALVVSAVVLGPALSPGLVHAYDLVWGADGPLTPFVVGQGVPAPRALPSDGLAVVLSSILGAGGAQKVVLLGALTGAACGAAALLRELRRDAPPVAGVVAAVAAVWNPFVGERLAIGHWTLLLACAALPWLVRAALRLRRGTGTLLPLLGLVAATGLGGANTLVGTVPVVLAVLLWPGGRQWRAAVATLVTTAGVSAVWVLPALVRGVPVSAGATDAFAPRPDLPLGVVASILTGGGIWNPAAVPPGRDSWAAALAALAILGAALAGHWVGRARGDLVWAAPLGATVVVVLVSALPGTSMLWQGLAGAVPGGGLLRDSQKLLVGWQLALALGLGLLAAWVVRRLAGTLSGAVVILVLVLLSPVALPGLGWGLSGRVDAVPVPEGSRTALRVASELPTGLTGVLPWRQYRRYDWNGARVSLTVVPRSLDQPVLFDDSLPLRRGQVSGEDPRARRVTQAIASGTDPYAALASEGVRYVVVERDGGLPVPDPPSGWPVVVSGGGLSVLANPGVEVAVPGLDGSGKVGWSITIATLLALLGWAVTSVMTTVRQRRRRSGYFLVRFHP